MLKVTPYCRSTLWGGSRLCTYFPQSGLKTIAEAWVFSLLPEGEGTANGILLREALIKEGIDPKIIDRLPLIKLIDTSDLLSVQVHHNDLAALKLEGQGYGKNEMWYVLSAEPGATLYHQLKSTKANFLSALNSGRPLDELRKVEVKQGDVFVIPAGMVHALGKGITLLEIQQPSNYTYRLWDYGRVDQNGQPRPLHVEKACEALREFQETEISAFQFANTTKSYTIENTILSKVKEIAKTPYFSIEIADIEENGTVSLLATDAPVILLPLAGEMTVTTPYSSLALSFGETAVVSKNDKTVTLRGHGKCALVSIPL